MADYTIDDIIVILKRVRDEDKKCALMIGAGCSVKAGVPTAAGFIEEIEKRYGHEYTRACKEAREKAEPDKRDKALPDYFTCMNELSVADGRALIAEFIDKAKLNWAHICIAQLIKEGYVDRVLTTNFDLLIQRACALLGVFPAVYDFTAMSTQFRESFVHDKAIYHLHGQRTGFALLNRERELKKQFEPLKPIIRDALSGRVCIVVGYSGTDPVFDHFAAVDVFERKLFWIGYMDNSPAKHLREKLLDKGKDAFYVADGYDADSFFHDLTKRLGCFPPAFVDQPFTHLQNLLEDVLPFSPTKGEGTRDVMEGSRKLIASAIKLETDASEINSVAMQADADMMAGNYDKVIALAEQYGTNIPPELRETVAWAFVASGSALADQAEMKSDLEAKSLYEQAYEKYARASAIEPSMSQVLFNWGTTLIDQAKTKSNVEAEELFDRAVEKLKKGNQIKSGDGSYNLACIASLRGQQEECRKWLADSKNHEQLPTKKHLEGDSDLNNMRDKQWFKDFLDSLEE